jgi:enamine deaminase RidA (YjgF/YER057c/UK114 family)
VAFVSADSSDIAARIHAAGICLPAPPAPAGAYRGVVMRDSLGFVSGQFPLVDGQLALHGRAGAELDLTDVCEAAEIAALNALAQIERATEGWRRFAGLLRMDGYVASTGDFTHVPAVLDAASRLFVRALGDELGAHTRVALPVSRLPLDAPIELALSFAVR